MPIDKVAFIKDFIQKIWNEKQTQFIEKYIDSAYTIHTDKGDPWEGKTLSHADFLKRLDNSFVPFPDIHFDIQSTVTDGDHVAIIWIMTGTNSGSIASFPPTNKTIQTFGATIYYFKDNLISGHSQVFDQVTVMKQLGFMA
jgi:predicted ester cyclase